jgi:hypothetical protein
VTPVGDRGCPSRSLIGQLRPLMPPPLGSAKPTFKSLDWSVPARLLFGLQERQIYECSTRAPVC